MSGPKPRYRRALVKVSGEALMGPESFGFHQPTLDSIAKDLVAARALGTELAVVVGGGNIFRGGQMSSDVLDRPSADSIGMLATIMNAIALAAAIEKLEVPARVLSGVPMPSVCESYSRHQAMDHMAHGRIVILGGGIGHPFFTTDTTAALRAAETKCQVVLKATNVDGIYTADPKRDPSATRYQRLTFDEAIERKLAVMDTSAFALARDAQMPIIVFSIKEPGAIAAVLAGQDKGTLVAEA